MHQSLINNINSATQARSVAIYALDEEKENLYIMEEVYASIKFAENFLRTEAKTISIFELQKIGRERTQIIAKIKLKKRIINNLETMIKERTEEIEKHQQGIAKLLNSLKNGLVLEFKR